MVDPYRNQVNGLTLLKSQAFGTEVGRAAATSKERLVPC